MTTDRTPPTDWQTVAAWINEVLQDDAAGIARRLLACDGCSYGKAVFTPASWPDRLNVEFVSRPGRSRRSGNERPRGVQILMKRNMLHVSMEEGQSFSDEQAFAILRQLARILLLGKGRFAATYIPAARTGLMLAFRTLIAGLLRSLSREEGVDTGRTTLAAPVVDFLEDLSDSVDFPVQDQPHYQIAEELERNILGGQITQGENEEVGYTPAASGVRLPMHAVSSLVTELAPLVIMLKYAVLCSMRHHAEVAALLPYPHVPSRDRACLAFGAPRPDPKEGG